ncbi:hypothetical protein [Aquimarina sp. RZ0]|uniref:hypothetical protein n=1 Tax=Aquimarina sp. RZ0 TaxID=2607730 RepID=UPI0011F16865|nr:hypothetical protein [Aquimarina sp. RZ0]KAA1245139.1 hypothetical protein F0000_13535 [Aquimarina sp. RZ0]
MNIPKFLFHYYEIEQGPFKNITDNTFEEAKNIQNNISVGFNSKRPPNYTELRFALEKRLKNEFISKGGKPKRENPFYFTLGECNWLKSCYHTPGVVKIPLDNFKSEQISFTYPDSMVSFQFFDEPKLKKYKKEYNGKVFVRQEMETVIKKYGIPRENIWMTNEEMKYDRYIEAQVWDDYILKDYLK